MKSCAEGLLYREVSILAPTATTPLPWHLTWRASCFLRVVSGSSNRDHLCSQPLVEWSPLIEGPTFQTRATKTIQFTELHGSS